MARDGAGQGAHFTGHAVRREDAHLVFRADSPHDAVLPGKLPIGVSRTENNMRFFVVNPRIR